MKNLNILQNKIFFVSVCFLSSVCLKVEAAQGPLPPCCQDAPCFKTYSTALFLSFLIVGGLNLIGWMLWHKMPKEGKVRSWLDKRKPSFRQKEFDKLHPKFDWDDVIFDAPDSDDLPEWKSRHF